MLGEIAVILMFFSLIGISVFFLLLRNEQLEEVKGDRKTRIEKEVKDKKAKSLAVMLDEILVATEEKVAKSKRLQEGTGARMKTSEKIQDALIRTINNPYNQTNVVNVVAFVVFLGAVGLLTGALLTNAAVAVAGMILGIVIPFSLINLRGLTRQMSMMRGNLTILMNHYPNLLDSSTFEESISRTLANSDNTPQAQAFRNCLINMVDSNMPMEHAVNILRKDLMAERYVNYYLDGVINSIKYDKEYKQVLGSVLNQFEYLVRVNTIISRWAYIIYTMYVCEVIGLIVAIAALRISDPEVYKLLAFTFAGQFTIAGIFAIAGILGFVISGAAKLVDMTEV